MLKYLNAAAGIAALLLTTAGWAIMLAGLIF